MCKCQICGRHYSVGLNVPNELWEIIRLSNKQKESGMMCGSCIMFRIETINQEHNTYRAFELIEIK